MRNQRTEFQEKATLERREPSKKPYDRILIVCEGSKSEPNYLKEIIADKKLLTANIQILHSNKGTAPSQVVDCAEKLFKEGNSHPPNRIEKKAFDRVYAVFDRDSHKSYISALDKIKSLDDKLKNDEGKTVPFIAIPSNPCFELWLLLHYQDVYSLLTCKAAKRELKEYLPNKSYKKSSVDIYQTTKSKRDEASTRARNLNKKCRKRCLSAPFTYLVELVDELINLKE